MDFDLSGDRVLIVAGYTDEEILRQASNSDSSTDNSNNTVADPPSFYFAAKNIEYQPHICSYEQFESAEGLIPMEKTCDRFAELSMEVLAHQNLSDMKGNLVIDSKTKEVRIRVADNSTINEETEDGDLNFKRWIRPSEYTDEYVNIRNNFFKDLDGRPLTIVSPLHPAIPVAYIDDVSQSIPEGEEEVTYTVTFKEYENTGF